MTVDTLIEEFSIAHDLPPSFLKTARDVYWPLLTRTVDVLQNCSKPLVMGVHGCQGSGKSTFTDFFLYACKHELSVSAVGFSLDDFYLTRAERQQLAKTQHPLLKTRGVPGTHDMAMLSRTLDQLIAGQLPVQVPVFNKALDDRAVEAQWQQVIEPPQLILLEGWCVGSPAEPVEALDRPVNDLERLEDPDKTWRSYVNDQLGQVYQSVFQRLDRLVMLRAPSFAAVQQWRQEQEDRLVAKLTRSGQPADAAMSPEQIARFVQHYQRITEHSLKRLPEKADVVVSLNSERQVLSVDGAL